jgi:hypothetical protein
MQDDLMKRLQDSLMGLNSVQDVQVPFRPEEEEIPEAQPQEIQQQEVIPQQEPEVPPQASQGIDTAPQPPIPPFDGAKTLEMLRAKILSSDDDYDAKLQAARDSDFKRTALTQALKVLGTAAMGQHQKAAGQSLGLKPIEMDEIKTQQSALEKSRKQGLEKLMQEYKLLQDEQTFKDSIDDKKVNRELKEAQIEALKNKSKGKTESVYDKEIEKQQVKKFVDTQNKGKDARSNDFMVDDVLENFLDYSRNTVGGTGPIATLGGFTKNFSESAQTLDSKFKNFSLDKMTKMFQGMSKAVDSDAERRAFEATAPSLTNDDDTNIKIILGAKATNLRNIAEAQAQKEYINRNGKLDEKYTSPVMDVPTTVLVDPRTGEMSIFNRNEKQEMIKKGYKDLDSYGKNLLTNKNVAKPISNPTADRGNKVQVEINGQIGTVPRENVEALLQKYPNAKVME